MSAASDRAVVGDDERLDERLAEELRVENARVHEWNRRHMHSLAMLPGLTRRRRRRGPSGPHKKGKDRLAYGISEIHIRRMGETISPTNRLFKRTCGYEYNVFMERIVSPIEQYLSDLKKSKTKRVRRSQLPLEARVFRMLTYLRRERMTQSSKMYGQTPQTCLRDSKVMVGIAYQVLGRMWVKLPLKTSDEYKMTVGKGVFAEFLPRCVYSGDMTFIPIAKPMDCDHPELFWNGKHGFYCIGFFTIADGHGYTKLVIGPFHGSISDTEVMKRLRLNKVLKKYVISISLSFRSHFADCCYL